MVKLDELKKMEKYYVTVDIPYTLNCPYRDCGMYNLRIQVLKLKPSVHENIPDYVTIQVLESSKEGLSEYGRNLITIPVDWIKNIETLHHIINTKSIDDMIYLIEQYV